MKSQTIQLRRIKEVKKSAPKYCCHLQEGHQVTRTASVKVEPAGRHFQHQSYRYRSTHIQLPFTLVWLQVMDISMFYGLTYHVGSPGWLQPLYKHILMVQSFTFRHPSNLKLIMYTYRLFCYSAKYMIASRRHLFLTVM